MASYWLMKYTRERKMAAYLFIFYSGIFKLCGVRKWSVRLEKKMTRWQAWQGEECLSWGGAGNENLNRVNKRLVVVVVMVVVVVVVVVERQG